MHRCTVASLNTRFAVRPIARSTSIAVHMPRWVMCTPMISKSPRWYSHLNYVILHKPGFRKKSPTEMPALLLNQGILASLARDMPFTSDIRAFPCFNLIRYPYMSASITSKQVKSRDSKSLFQIPQLMFMYINSFSFIDLNTHKNLAYYIYQKPSIYSLKR